MIKIKKSEQVSAEGAILVLCSPGNPPEAPGLLSEGREFLETKDRTSGKVYVYQQISRHYVFGFFDPSDLTAGNIEKVRQCGVSAATLCKTQEYGEVSIYNSGIEPSFSLAAAEGIALGSYAFSRYRRKDESRKEVQKLVIVDDKLGKKQVEHHSALLEAVCFARDLVNEPPNVLTAEEMAKRISDAATNYGIRSEVFGRKKIESLKMGGILAVNRGSVLPPTFSILEWKPEKAKNKKPLVLVGKGVVYDTGGLSLKPTPASMDMMKCDMAGAAAVAGAIIAIAAQKLPVHVIALIPASDNRPGGNAYTPGDIITMYDGTTVEVRNTDAEGRLLLADALAYASRFKPALVIEASTLTGAAVRAVGTQVVAAMGTADEEVMETLTRSADATWERIIRFPLWDEYGEEMKSEIADLNNLGGPYAGQITAGKFLEHFTSYPFIHLDIAGPAFLTSAKGYLPAGGTGVGVRLIVDFVKKQHSL